MTLEYFRGDRQQQRPSPEGNYTDPINWTRVTTDASPHFLFHFTRGEEGAVRLGDSVIMINREQILPGCLPSVLGRKAVPGLRISLTHVNGVKVNDDKVSSVVIPTGYPKRDSRFWIVKGKGEQIEYRSSFSDPFPQICLPRSCEQVRSEKPQALLSVDRRGQVLLLAYDTGELPTYILKSTAERLVQPREKSTASAKHRTLSPDQATQSETAYYYKEGGLARRPSDSHPVIPVSAEEVEAFKARGKGIKLLVPEGRDAAWLERVLTFYYESFSYPISFRILVEYMPRLVELFDIPDDRIPEVVAITRDIQNRIACLDD